MSRYLHRIGVVHLSLLYLRAHFFAETPASAQTYDTLDVLLNKTFVNATNNNDVDAISKVSSTFSKRRRQ